MKRTLTAAQAQRREVLREIAAAGGLVESLTPGTNEVHDVVLSSTDFNDQGLTHMRELKELVSLGLGSTQVSDAGLVPLQSLTKLWHLDLFGAEVTETGLAPLQQSLPGLKISR